MLILGTVNLTQILSGSSYPEPAQGGNAALYGVFVIDDYNICVVYSGGNYCNSSGFAVLVVASNGNYTWYSTPYMGQYSTANYYVSNVISFGYGKFLIVASNANGPSKTFFLSPISLQSNNKIPILIEEGNSFINIPCYNYPSFFAYDSIRGYIGAASYNPVGQFGGPCYSSNYSAKYGALTLLTTGFVGNYVSGTSNNFDPYNQTQNHFNGTIVANTNRTQSNGVSTLLAYDLNNNYFIGVNTYRVNPGIPTNDCLTPNLSSVTSKNLQCFFQNNNYNEYKNRFDTNIPGIVGGTNPYGSPSGTGALQIFDAEGNVGDILYYPQVSSTYGILTNKYFWNVDTNYNIQIGPVSIPSLYFMPFVNRTPHPLANFSHSAQNVFFRS